MLHSHFLSLLIFSFLVSLVMATLRKDSPREILRTGAVLMAKMVLGVVAISWLMYLI